MFGLIVSDPARDTARRGQLRALLHTLDLPFSAFTEADAPRFSPDMSRAAFLRTASCALLIPGEPLPLALLLTHLSTPDPLPANVLRRHLFLHWSLRPYLQVQQAVTPLEGCFLLGDDLLVAPVSPEDTVDALLPPGVWTELTGQTHTGHLRCMRGYNETPVLARENALIPISINGQSLTLTTPDDADRLTLHWYQPGDAAQCTLADGTSYDVTRSGEQVRVHADTNKPFHLILHQDGVETLVK